MKKIGNHLLNRAECKKYLRRAYKQTIAHNKSITPKNIEDEIKKVIKQQSEKYITFAKIAVDNMQKSANDHITIEDLMSEIDVLPRIYTETDAIEKAKNL